MNIFTIEHNRVIVTADALLIPHFAEIWNRDKSKEKSKAISELSYIYFMSDYKSIYSSYAESVREKQIKLDILKNDKYEPDDVIRDAIIKYMELQETPTLRLLKSAKHALEEVSEYYNTVKPTDRNVTAIAGSIEKIGKIAESLDKLEDKIRREIQTEGRSKADRQINEFEK